MIGRRNLLKPLVKVKNIAIIPARGGSKRLPNKNMLMLSDMPLIAHSINFAKANRDIISDIYVSTNDENIKSLSLDLGVKVIDRPEELSGDFSTTVSALKHVLETINETVDNIILLQPTNPLRQKQLLKEAYVKYVDGDFDSLMTVSSSKRKLGKIDNDNFIPFNYKMGQRSQDMEPLYFENGLLYISKVDLILNDIILGSKNCPFIVNHPYELVDIDTKEDLKYAQFVLENYPNE
ncbi:acylneuraminate cytidylyltransferase family protein [Pontimicrobium sp. SW4]|uniref:Acylneuraminate cytidylyltransferase family protein n=1 Tax=Pontimicrobium sp. SW4 TaxID=3153519 RepID=A0AAU7BV57_9FLAO